MLDVNKILDMSITLTSEHDYNKILEKIVTCAMDLTNCEGGTLYLYRNERLEFMIMRNVDPEVQRRGGKAAPVELDEAKVCGYTALHRTLVNVPDVYAESTDFDFERNGIIGAWGNKTQWFYYAKDIQPHIAAIDEVCHND